MTLACASCSVAGAPDGQLEGQLEQNRTSWHAGSFRHLPSMSGDVESLVMGFEHPRAGGYVTLGSSRTAEFTTFLNGLFQALEDSLANGDRGDWCGVITQATAAGYGVRRYHDTATRRWFVYGFDTTVHGSDRFRRNTAACRVLRRRTIGAE
jgi:hypothetical protein